MLTRKYDSVTHKDSIRDFIPILDHIDDNTLITKDGCLIQTIYVEGINPVNLPMDLSETRSLIRETIKKNLNLDELSIWVHTIRDFVDLKNDSFRMNNEFSSNIWRLWNNHNKTDKKLLNSVYLSVVYKPARLNLSNISSFFNSLSMKTIFGFHNNYIEMCLDKLHKRTSSIISDLSSINARILSVKQNSENNSYSENLSFFASLMHLEKYDFDLPKNSFDIIANNRKYEFSRNHIKVKSDSNSKFASILSLKEYIEIPDDVVDYILSSEIRFVCTEIFYPISENSGTKNFSYGKYVLGISQSEDIIKAKRLNAFFDHNSERTFCDYQISFMPISDTLKDLGNDILKLSNRLSDVGLIHVKEDINLEKVFYSQIPSNFIFISRKSQNLLDFTCGFAITQNFPAGSISSKWGRNIAIFKNFVGTIYFFNFHDYKGNGHTCVYGGKKSGKTSLTNFLLTNALQNKLTVLHLSVSHRSHIFIKAINGSWYDEDHIFNPLILDNTQENRELLYKFFLIICDHFRFIMEQGQLDAIKEFVDHVFATEKNQRKFSALFSSFDFKVNEDRGYIQKRLNILTDPKYTGIFDSENEFKISKNQIMGVNIHRLSNLYYKENYYPADEKLLSEYNRNIKLHQNIRSAYVLFLLEIYNLSEKDKNILAMDDILEILDHEHFVGYFDQLQKTISDNNGLILSSMGLENTSDYNEKLFKKILESLGTQILLGIDNSNTSVGKILNLTKEEIKEFNSLIIQDRLFMLKQNDTSIILESKFAGISDVFSILSASKEDIEKCKKLISENKKWIDSYIKK